VSFTRRPTLAACGSRKMLARYCEERVKSGVATALSGRRRPRSRAPADPSLRPAPADAAAAALGCAGVSAGGWAGPDNVLPVSAAVNSR
jgi:hypothetical protein